MTKFEPRPKMRRKRRASSGEDVIGALTKERATLDLGKDRGLRCRTCGKWRGWKDLCTKYERRGSDVHRLWVCDQCGDVLLDQNATDQGIRLKTDEREVILICGDRLWTDVKAVARILRRHEPIHTIVRAGGARGADKIAEQLAARMGFEVDVCEADWEQHGKAAGPIRNRRMLLKEPRPSRVYALHDDLAASKGTANMVKIARRAKVPVTLVRHRQV